GTCPSFHTSPQTDRHPSAIAVSLHRTRRSPSAVAPPVSASAPSASPTASTSFLSTWVIDEPSPPQRPRNTGGFPRWLPRLRNAAIFFSGRPDEDRRS